MKKAFMLAIEFTFIAAVMTGMIHLLVLFLQALAF